MAMDFFLIQQMMKYAGYLLLLLYLASSCELREKRERKKCEGEAVLGFEFDIPYRVVPVKDTYNVGDTLWIESQFSSQLHNKRNGKTYTLDPFDFRMSGVILDLQTNPCLPTTAYDMVNSASELYASDRSGSYFFFRYVLSDGFYHWKAGFVLKQAGMFAVLPDTDIDLYNLQQQHPPQRITSCNYEAVSLNIQRKDAPSHIALLQLAADPYVREPWDIGPFEETAYAFYVKP
jgi:hypothetical protein